jgi:hypothetical protein
MLEVGSLMNSVGAKRRGLEPMVFKDRHDIETQTTPEEDLWIARAQLGAVVEIEESEDIACQETR